MTQEIELRSLVGDPGEMTDLQRVLEQSPTYAHLVTGAPPDKADAQSMYSILPDGKTYEDKYM